MTAPDVTEYGVDTGGGRVVRPVRLCRPEMPALKHCMNNLCFNTAPSEMSLLIFENSLSAHLFNEKHRP